MVRIPAGATNIDIKQVSYSGKPEDDNYLGECAALLFYLRKMQLFFFFFIEGNNSKQRQTSSERCLIVLLRVPCCSSVPLSPNIASAILIAKHPDSPTLVWLGQPFSDSRVGRRGTCRCQTVSKKERKLSFCSERT